MKKNAIKLLRNEIFYGAHSINTQQLHLGSTGKSDDIFIIILLSAFTPAVSNTRPARGSNTARKHQEKGRF
jgi:hypothetical protein